MNKKEYVLWGNDYRDDSLLIEKNGIEEFIFTGDDTYYIEGIDLNTLNLDNLNQMFSEFKDNIEEPEEDEFADVQDRIAKFFKHLDMDVKVGSTPEYMQPCESLVFNSESNHFSNLSTWEETKVYEYWNGHNMSILSLDENKIETEIILGGCTSLDEWDGQNSTTGGFGQHQIVFKIHTVNGEVTENEFLINTWSDFQGTHETGKIVTIDELRNYLKELDRDVEYYMKEIEKLP